VIDLLRAEGIACGYGTHTVLDDFNLTAEPASVTVLLGANGAGKSTALRALSRLLRPRQGTVTLGGRDIWRLPLHVFVLHVAFLPQTEAPSWPMTVEQLVLLGRAPHRGWLLPYAAADREAADTSLRQMDMTGLRHRNLASLSGGEQRRAMLARALAQGAQILLLDEPVAHLDLRHQLELFGVLRRLSRECGVAVVLSLHDLNLAAAFADRLLLLVAGRSMAQGVPAEVLTPERIRIAFGVAVEVAVHVRRGGSTVVSVLPILEGDGNPPTVLSSAVGHPWEDVYER
jgi:iron complex transport system ATP-binding protein